MHTHSVLASSVVRVREATAKQDGRRDLRAVGEGENVPGPGCRGRSRSELWAWAPGVHQRPGHRAMGRRAWGFLQGIWES